MSGMKLLNGLELAGFIKERQAKDVRRVKQALGVQPKLAIVYTLEHGPSLTYMGMKQRYGADIGVDVDIHYVEQAKVTGLLADLNADANVHGIIVQLPLADASETDEVVNAIAPEKDVDGLGETAPYTPANTPGSPKLFPSKPKSSQPKPSSQTCNQQSTTY
jgi:methylenetetrahydrofolate dehydrogenase (NADP+)/methenyltetrahydrofolate cyclohydrolase